MKNLDNTYLVKDTIYSKGPSSCGYSFFKYFLKKNKDIKSVLDIGCGNGKFFSSASPFLGEKGKYIGIDVVELNINFCTEIFIQNLYLFVELLTEHSGVNSCSSNTD